MPLYHFNIYDGLGQPDHEGSELPDWQAARVEAVRLAGAVLKDDAKHVASGEDWHMDVTDERGRLLIRLDFSVAASPATMPSP